MRAHARSAGTPRSPRKSKDVTFQLSATAALASRPRESRRQRSRTMKERGRSGHAGQHGVPSGEAEFRLPQQRFNQEQQVAAQSVELSPGLRRRVAGRRRSASTRTRLTLSGEERAACVLARVGRAAAAACASSSGGRLSWSVVGRRLSAHRVRNIPCPHAPSRCGRLAVDA